MNKEKLKLVLELYKDGKIDFEQAVLLLDVQAQNGFLPGTFQRGGVVPGDFKNVIV